ncbi:hypothetical protein GCM10007937_24990 [Mesorhizobium albiziae]|nr:hypothetical protein [Mesorhizobium albiziae]GLS30791.1 hypothetical protein GCM10007937_24990 [Mesorhizobium albiziae]
MKSSAIAHLVAETGITDEDARELVLLFGANNWPSLLREARMLSRKT